MWYGGRAAWYDDRLPFEMNVDLANPAYSDHLALDCLEFAGRRLPDGILNWREQVQPVAAALLVGSRYPSTPGRPA
jgi:hypothetical protein